MTAEVYENMWTLNGRGLSEQEFNDKYRVGLIERLRGQNAATTVLKAQFMESVLVHMQERDLIASWSYIGNAGRADYSVKLPTGRVAVIEAKGSLDGLSATSLERPSYADELVIWSMTTNPMSNVVANLWSGIHSRISADYVAAGKRIDTLVAWDLLGSSERLCEGLADLPKVPFGDELLTPPCIHLLPNELPILGTRPKVAAPCLDKQEFAQALATCFGVPRQLVGQVDFEIFPHEENGLARRTTIWLDGELKKQSGVTPIRRDLKPYWRAVAVALKEGQKGSV